MTERGIDVDSDQTSVSGDRRRSTSCDGQRREPGIEIVLERDATGAHECAVLELGERVVERGLCILLRAEATLTNLPAPPATAADVQHETPRASTSLDASGPAHARILRSAGWENAGVPSTAVCTEGLNARLRRRPWSPFGHGDYGS